MGNNIQPVNNEVPEDVEGQCQSEEDVFYDTVDDDDLVHVAVGVRSKFCGDHVTAPPRQDNHVTVPPRQDNHVTAPPRQDNHVTAPPREDNYVTVPPRQNNHVTAPPREDNHVTAPPREDNHVTAPPREDNYVTVPPRQDNHVTAPPRQDNHVTAPPRQDNHVTAPPHKDNQVIVLPHEGNHVMATPHEGISITAQPREDMIAPPHEDNQVMTPPHQDDHVDNPPHGDELHVTWRDHSFISESMHTSMEWEEDISDPFEKVLARRGCQKTHLKSQEKAAEDKNTNTFLQDMKKLQVCGNQQDRRTQQQNINENEEQDSRIQHHYIGEKTHTLLQAMKKLQEGGNQQDRRTQQQNINENEEQDSRTQHYLDEQLERKTVQDHLYGNDEFDSRTKQHCDVERQDSRTQDHYEAMNQDERTQQYYDGEAVKQDKTHHHCSKDGDEHNSRPHYYYKGEQQNSKTEQYYDDEQDTRLHHHYDDEKQGRTQHLDDNDDDSDEQNEQDSRPQHHYDDEKQGTRTQHLGDDDDSDEQDEQNSRAQHHYDDKKQGTRTQHYDDDEQDEQNSRAQHHYDDEKQGTRTQHLDNDDDSDEQDSRAQHHYDDKKQGTRTQHLDNDDDSDEQDEQCSKPQHNYDDKKQGTRTQHLDNDDDSDEQDEQNSRPQHHYDDEKQGTRTQHLDDDDDSDEQDEQCSKPQHNYDDKKQGTRTQQHNDEDEHYSSLQHHYDDDEDDEQDRTRQHYLDGNEEQDGRTLQQYHKEENGRTSQHNDGEQDSRTSQHYDSEAQGRRGQHHYTDKDEACRPQYHGSEGETSKTWWSGQKKHTSSRGRGRGCVRGGHHWMGWQESQPYSHHTRSWRHHKQLDMQDGHRLSWRHKHPRRMYGNHPYHSGNYWSQRQHQQHNPNSYYWRETDDGLDSSALNGVDTDCEDRGGALEPEELTSVLVERPTFRATFVNLLDYQFFAPESVRQVATACPHIFHINKDGVKLQPQVRLCQAHLSVQGCINYLSCRDLHVCSTYISSWCSETPCPHGHSLYTEHNKAILNTFSLAHLPVMHLKKLLKHLILSVVSPSSCIDVCRDYNRGQCDKTDCQALHLCLRFVVGRAKCDRPKCGLNHNPVKSQTCCMLLTAHGISINETIMDIIVALLRANPNLATADATKPLPPSQSLPDTRVTPENTSPRKPSTFFDRVKQKFGLNNDPSRSKDSPGLCSQKGRGSTAEGSMDEDFSYSKSERSRGSGQGNGDKAVHRSGSDGKHPSGSKSPSGRAQGGQQTVWDYHRKGNVNIAEICRFSVEGICLKEEKGCLRLHASRPFHWQTCESEGQDSWLNLPGTVVNCLELAFCDPAKNGVRLPPLTTSQLRRLGKVLDQDTWYANFEAMVLTNSDYSKLVALRRLCVGAGAAPQHAKSCTFSWFFCDIRGRWVKYGQADTTGQTSLKSSVTSADIETHYLARPNLPLSFKVSQFTYIINFGTMTQTNQTTKVQRAVRRRPEPHPSLHLADTQRHQPHE